MGSCVDAGLACALFSDVRANPVETNVHDGVAVLREGDRDEIIAFGGGSALDVGKAIGLMAGRSRPIWDFEDREDRWIWVAEDGMLPAVAVPTASGTGLETGCASVITDTRTEPTKRIIFHPRTIPGRARALPRPSGPVVHGRPRLDPCFARGDRHSAHPEGYWRGRIVHETPCADGDGESVRCNQPDSSRYRGTGAPLPSSNQRRNVACRLVVRPYRVGTGWSPE